MTDDLTHTENELCHCPSCGSDDISYDGGFCDGSQLVSCGDCYAKWYEVWTYAGIMMVEGEVNQTED